MTQAKRFNNELLLMFTYIYDLDINFDTNGAFIT